jgi:hypothetical protein
LIETRRPSFARFFGVPFGAVIVALDRDFIPVNFSRSARTLGDAGLALRRLFGLRALFVREVVELFDLERFRRRDFAAAERAFRRRAGFDFFTAFLAALTRRFTVLFFFALLSTMTRFARLMIVRLRRLVVFLFLVFIETFRLAVNQ